MCLQEKVDGSQFSFANIDHKLYCRSKGAQIDVDDPPKLFKEGVEYLKYHLWAIPPNYIYRCEYLQKPKHNTLMYDRIPKNHFVLLDAEPVAFDQGFRSDKVKAFAEEIGIDYVPTFFVFDHIEHPEVITEFLEKESFLGGPKIEGVVIKAYGIYGKDGKTLMGKYVSESYKEANGQKWKPRNKKGVIYNIINTLGTERRWEKAVQHLRDDNKLESDPRDIGSLFKAVHMDILEEETDWVKQKLFDAFKKDILKGSTRGLPEWYKKQLMESCFEKEEVAQP